MDEIRFPLTVGETPIEESRPVSQSQATMTQLMTPMDANLFGNVFGGVVLAAVDKIAYVCGARHAGQPCLTASFDRVDFREPIGIGELVTLKAAVNYVGRTSMEVGVRVTAEDVYGGEGRHTNSCYVTVVAVDESGRPTPVPKLVIEDEEQYRRYRDAEERRRAHLQLAEEQRRRRERRER
jgi:acyl-CoA hydrolase